MTHHHHVPGFPLNQFIAGFTYYKNYRPNHSIDRYLPNGNIELIIDLTDTPKFIYDNDTLTEIQSYKSAWISGMRNNFITIPSGLDAEMFIIEFKKGMVYPLLRQPVTEITGRVVECDLLFGNLFTQLREQLHGLPVTQMFFTAETILLKKFNNQLSVNPFVDFAVQTIVTHPQTTSIRHLAAKTGYSAKHFIKIFSDNVGVTPKSFLRIIRFQKAVQQMHSGANINWAALASECGYYDQAHFIADFKDFSGFTPVVYFNRKSTEWLDYVAVK